MDREAWKSLSLEHAVSIQTKLRPMVVQKGEKRAEEFETVAGIDLAYWSQGEREYAVCCVVVLRQSTKEVVESVYSFGEVEVPYIPGCLAFRELPLILETVKKLTAEPELYLFDGNGYLHPRRMGIATHASFYLGKPTIGVAKHYYKLEDAQFTMPANERFAYTDIVAEGEVCGRVLRTVKDVRPVFVSVGNYIDLDTATKVVRGFVNGESHIPMPTRLADIETHRRRRELSAV
ncbi:MAG: endonuclease V [Hungatella sp.]|nr:endonuclease V [Hungatella sp.]MCI9501850.1 endonuclease V [Hungatella sp.]MCI9636885.1 endonuclease V [Hungatella sp.]